jgi:hypothetical protein
MDQMKWVSLDEEWCRASLSIARRASDVLISRHFSLR